MHDIQGEHWEEGIQRKEGIWTIMQKRVKETRNLSPPTPPPPLSPCHAMPIRTYICLHSSTVPVIQSGWLDDTQLPSSVQ